MVGRDSNPETEADIGQWQDALSHSLKQLNTRDVLVLRLRFERDLTFAEIAGLMGFKNAQAADRCIQKSIDKLRQIMDTLDERKI